eukprot:1136707-Pelagomonas_calceolata.AAC.6
MVPRNEPNAFSSTCLPAPLQGIYPALSLFNNLMDWYAGELRLGDVVRLLTDMTQHAKLQVRLLLSCNVPNAFVCMKPSGMECIWA